MKSKIKILITLVIGIIIGTLGYVMADNIQSIINANQVGYSNSTKTQKTDVQGAIDELYNMANTHCPNNYNCHDTKNSRVVPATYGETFKAIVYLDPANPSNNCHEDNSTKGAGITGCMKWYAYSETATTYNLILDHCTDNGSFYSMEGKLANLIKNTNEGGSGWSSLINPRLINIEEIRNIVGNEQFAPNSSSDRLTWYFDSLNNTQISNNENKSKYYWLFDYLNSCEVNGCYEEIQDENCYHYWTSSISGFESNPYVVGYLGAVSDAYPSSNRCLRPVITVNKSDLGI